jgi:hypothetical protein
MGLGAIALAMPAAASAVVRPQPPAREIQQATTSGVAYLGEAGGYEIGVANPSRHVAILYINRIGEDGGSFTGTAYAVRPQSSIESGVLRARFGALGTVALRFRPSGKTKIGHPGRHCSGRAPQTEDGEYQGSVSLRGEDGYFHIRTEKASGIRRRTFQLTCAPGQAHNDESKPLFAYVAPNEGFTVSSGGGSIALLLAISKYGGRFVYLRAAHMQGADPGAEVQAGALEEEPGMAIGHSAEVGGGEGTLLTSLPGAHPATATLAPPAPFHGEANFVENSSTSHSWTGTLGVNFPGLDLPLAGSTYATSLCVLSPFKAGPPCDFRKLPRMPE